MAGAEGAGLAPPGFRRGGGGGADMSSEVWLDDGRSCWEEKTEKGASGVMGGWGFCLG